MPDKEQNDWKLYSIRKLVEYGTLFVAAWQLGIPAANNWHESRTKVYMDEHKDSKPFREVLSEEWDIKKDRVHIYMKNQDDKLNDIHTKFLDLESHINYEKTHPTQGVVIKDGVEYWKDSNGNIHKIHRNEEGRGMYFDNGAWNYTYW